MNKLKCLYTNADNLTNKLNELRTLCQQHKPHIIAITEITPKNCKQTISESIFKIKGYNTWHNLDKINAVKNQGTRSSDPSLRGVIVYTADSINCNLELNITNQFRDAIFISVKLKGENHHLLIGTIYRSGKATAETNNQLNLSLRCLTADKKFSHLLVMGDFNFKNIDWETNTIKNTSKINAYEEQVKKPDETFLKTIQDIFLYQQVNHPTRARGSNKPSLIDLILTNEKNMVSEIEYLSPIAASDHNLLKFDYNCYISHSNNTKTKYFYDKSDFTSMKTLFNIDWNKLFEASRCLDDSDKQFNLLQKIYNDAVSNHVPRKSVSTCNFSSKSKGIPVDRSIRNHIRKKHRLWQRYMETKDPTKYQNYKKQRNKVKGLIIKIKKNLEKNVVNKIIENPKHFWAYVNSKTKTKQTIPDLECPKTRTKVSSPEEKATLLSNHFKSVFTIDPNPDYIPELPSITVKKELSSMNISHESVVKKLKNLNVSKSPGPDNIHPRILKELASVIAVPLTIIFNTSLKNRNFPNKWKTADIVPIHKKDSRSTPSNYRPISLTSLPCKIMESIIKDKILEHINENKLFTAKQYGFVSGRSTILQLMKILDNWTEILENKGQIDCVYLDFGKAFDSVPHKKLLDKVKNFGINGDILAWIKNFLSNRTQRVLVNDAKSEPVYVTSGVPQGSILGPLLFLIYINDLPDMCKSSVYMFADDTKLFRQIKSKVDNQHLQDDINTLCNWSSKWLLKFNEDKCKILSLNQRFHKTYYMSSNAQLKSCLKSTSCEKDLGIFIDKKLDFNYHITQIVKAANQKLGIIKRSFNYLDNNMFLKLYKALIRPQIEYGNTIWHPHWKKDIEQVEKVQRRATKYLTSLSRLSYSDRLKQLNLYSMAYRRLRGDMIEVYKILSNTYDPVSAPTLHVIGETTTRGNGKKLINPGPFPSTTLRKNFFTQRVTTTWNNLPRHVVWSNSVDVFKHSLDAHWINNDLKFSYQT